MNKRIIVLASINLVLLITFVLGLFTSPEAKSTRIQSARYISNFDTERVAKISINDVELSRRDGIWYRIQETDLIPARSDRIADLLTGIQNLRGVRTISSDVSKQDDYGFASERQLSFFDKTDLELLSIRFGGPVQGSSAVYAISSRDEAIISMSNSIDYHTQQNEFFWTDLRLFTDRPGISDVERIEIEQEGAEKLVLIQVRKDSSELNENVFQWVFEDDPDQEVDQTKAQGIIRSIVNLEGSDVEPFYSDNVPIGTARVITADSAYAIQVFPLSRSEEVDAEQEFLAKPNLGNTGFGYIMSDAIKNRILRDQFYFTAEENS